MTCTLTVFAVLGAHLIESVSGKVRLQCVLEVEEFVKEGTRGERLQL